MFSGKKACGYSGEVRKSVGSVGWLVRWIRPGNDGCRCLCAAFGVCEREREREKCVAGVLLLPLVCWILSAAPLLRGCDVTSVGGGTCIVFAGCCC